MVLTPTYTIKYRLLISCSNIQERAGQIDYFRFSLGSHSIMIEVDDKQSLERVCSGCSAYFGGRYSRRLSLCCRRRAGLPESHPHTPIESLLLLDALTKPEVGLSAVARRS